MNPMIAALQKSRKDSQSSDSTGNRPITQPPRNPGDMMVQKLSSLESKLDEILKLLSGKAPADEAKENEPNGNGNGY